jgi:hypothetical protein
VEEYGREFAKAIFYNKLWVEGEGVKMESYIDL